MAVASRADSLEADAAAAALPEGARKWLLIVFLLALLMPIEFEVATLRLNPYRLYLMIAALPFAIALLAGRGGRIVAADWLILGFVVWQFVALVFHHGSAQIPYAGITGTELFAGYMSGRLLIRSQADYLRFIRYLLVTLALMAPLALHELVTGRMLLAEQLSRFFDVVSKNDATRLGLSRVQVVFPHAILFGLFCSLAVANVFNIYRGRVAALLWRLALVVGMTFTSLSAAPLLSVMTQTMLVIWDKITSGRWWLLAGTVAFLYVALDLASNRTPVTILIDYATFDAQTAWWRIHIWNYGSAEVLRHPLLGIGLNDWRRPVWMVSSSVDNFWLLTAMRYGLPALCALMVGMLVHAAAIMRAPLATEGGKAMRTGHLIALTGGCLTLGTVHIWDALLVYVMFYIGAGAFFYTAPEAVGEADQAGPPPPRRPLPYTRAHPPQQYGKTSGR